MNYFAPGGGQHGQKALQPSRLSFSNVSKDELLKYYRDMLLIRRFEEKAGQLYGMG